MVGAIIGGVLGLAQLGIGAYQKNKAKKMSGNRPDYEIPNWYYDNLGLAEQQAQTGFSPQTLNFLSQTLQQNLAGSTNAILQGGGSINSIADLYATNAQQMKSLGVEEDKLRQSKIAQLIEARKDLAGQELAEWKFNRFDSWKDKQVAAAALASNANSTMNQGMNTAISSAGQLGQYYDTKKIPTNSQMMQKKNDLFTDFNHNVDNVPFPQSVNNPTVNVPYAGYDDELSSGNLILNNIQSGQQWNGTNW